MDPKKAPINYTWAEVAEDEPNPERRRYFVVYTVFGYEIIYVPYPSYCEQDALDDWADWAHVHAPGYCADPARLDELRADATAKEFDADTFIDEYYIRAGNASEYFDIPADIAKLTQTEIDALLASE